MSKPKLATLSMHPQPNAACVNGPSSDTLDLRMNLPSHKPCRSVASLLSPALRLLFAVFLVFGIAACSSKNKEPKPKQPRKPRDPVEQKVFYDGWWPEHWRR